MRQDSVMSSDQILALQSPTLRSQFQLEHECLSNQVIIILIIIIRDREEIFSVARVSLKGTHWPVVGGKAEVLVVMITMTMKRQQCKYCSRQL